MDDAVNEKRARFKTFKALIKAGKSDEANIDILKQSIRHNGLFGVLSWKLKRKCRVTSLPMKL